MPEIRLKGMPRAKSGDGFLLVKSSQRGKFVIQKLKKKMNKRRKK